MDLSFDSEGRLVIIPERESERVQAGKLIATLNPATHEDALKLAKVWLVQLSSMEARPTSVQYPHAFGRERYVTFLMKTTWVRCG